MEETQEGLYSTFLVQLNLQGELFSQIADSESSSLMNDSFFCRNIKNTSKNIKESKHELVHRLKQAEQERHFYQTHTLCSIY